MKEEKKFYHMQQAFGQAELHAREAVCTRYEPPQCASHCPIHVDARALCAAVAEGGYDKGLALLRAATPFVRLIAAACPAPCQAACVLPDGIRINALEQVCVQEGTQTRQRFLLPRKNQTAAVVGDDLFAVAAAVELGLKGYAVDLYTDRKDLAEILAEWGLSAEDAAADLAVVASLRLSHKPGSQVSAVAAGLGTPETAALGTPGTAGRGKTEPEAAGPGTPETAGLGTPGTSGRRKTEPEATGLGTPESGAAGPGTPEPGTAWLQADMYGAVCRSPSLAAGDDQPDFVFTGEDAAARAATGDVLSAAKSVVGVLHLAKSAALSADRYMQGVQSEAGRKREGAYESTLYVSPEDIAAAKPSELGATPASGKAVGEAQARAEAARCIQCECRECIRGCAFLQHYKSDPRHTIREVYNNLSIVMGDHMSNTMINSCALCDQCTVTCPFGFNVREVCLIARNTMVETGKMPPSTHEFALLDMAFSNSEAFLARLPKGRVDCAYLFFPGCQAGAVSPLVVETAYRDLCDRLEGGVGLMLGCCGAIAYWAGRQSLFEETLSQLETAWRDMGRPTVITACPTCKAILDEHTAMATEGVWEVLERIGLPAAVERMHKRVVVRDACGARGDGVTHDSVRHLLATAGYDVQEAAYNRDASPCCGWGGLVAYANRPLATEMAVFDTDPVQTYVSYCMACKDRLARAGRDSRHVLELVYGLESTPPADLSMRRYNRLDLKNRLLEELWGEAVEQREKPYTLHMDDHVRNQMEDRLILESDIYQVIDQMRETGCAVCDETTGHLYCSCRIGYVTFWVGYSEAEDGYTIHSVYSHRMTVEVL